MKKELRDRRVGLKFTQKEYDEYLAPYERAFDKNGKKYTVSDFIRDCVLNQDIEKKRIKVVRNKKPSECHKERNLILIKLLKELRLLNMALDHIFDNPNYKNYDYSDIFNVLINIEHNIKRELS